MHLAETFNVRDTNELKSGVRRLLGQEAIWEEAS